MSLYKSYIFLKLLLLSGSDQDFGPGGNNNLEIIFKQITCLIINYGDKVSVQEQVLHLYISEFCNF